MNTVTKDGFERTRILYIIEAALEYFVALACGTVYLAKITSYMGVSDDLTAILTSFVSLGCSFQLIFVFLAGKVKVRPFVTAGHIVSQLLFTFLYVTPLIPMSAGGKTAVFVAVLFSAQVIHNAINPPKIGWYMSMVPDSRRGSFTAKKEIVSLIGGVIFTYFLGSLFDYFEGAGRIETAFLIAAIALFTISVGHTCTLIFAQSPQNSAAERKRAGVAEKKGGSLKRTLKNKNLWKVCVAFSLLSVANYTTTSFSGTYMNGELGFSLTFSSVVIFIGCMCRAACSPAIGKLGDKKGFNFMLMFCVGLQIVGYFLNSFTRPSNGKVLYTIYYVFFCVAGAGTGNATINLVYDCVEEEDRTVAFAVNQCFSGLAGFLITVVLSPLLSKIQSNGNVVFGRKIYAQQLFSFLSFLLACAAICYLYFVIRKLSIKKNVEKTSEEIVSEEENTPSLK